MGVKGIEGMTVEQLHQELQHGGRFVVYTYTVSVILLTLRQPTSIHFVRGGESAFATGIPFSLITLFAGWWGFPFGPIYTIWSLVENSAGGKDVTQEVLAAIGPPSRPPAQEDNGFNWRPQM